MPRTFAVAVLLAVLALAVLSPARVGAGPPEGASGKMVLDDVADGLRRYRAEKDEGKRLELMGKLAPTRDPRVALMIVDGPPGELRPDGQLSLLGRYYVPDGYALNEWWEKNEADLRRRAKQLPK